MFGSLTASPQLLILVLIAVIVVGFALWRVSSRRGKHRTKRATRRKNPLSPARSTGSHREHGEIVAQRYGHSRSPEWAGVAREHLLHEPGCAVCGYTGHGLQVHHIKPFHLYPELELDQRNLITLCEIKGRDHHLLLGHLDDWESYNVHVRNDTKRFHGESARRLRANSAWQKEVMQRPMPT
jgi:5-methylcytosine-specific restriction endonuclease McrA